MIKTNKFVCIYRYILDSNSFWVLGFGIVVSIVVLPNVLFNLYVMAFGFDDHGLMLFLKLSEILFFLEIV